MTVLTELGRSLCFSNHNQQMSVSEQEALVQVPHREHDDPSFIVLTETKFSFRCIPVWDRYSPHRTRVEIKKHM